MGNGSVFICENCGYTLHCNYGVGFCYPIETSEILSDIRKGILGKHLEKLANEAKDPHVEYTWELYRCSKCGELKNERKIRLYDGTKLLATKMQICDKCHSKMKLTKETNEILCPKCKSNILLDDMCFRWD